MDHFKIGQQPASFFVEDHKNHSDLDKIIQLSQAIVEGNWTRMDLLINEDFIFYFGNKQFDKNYYISLMQIIRSSIFDFKLSLKNLIFDENTISASFTIEGVYQSTFFGFKNIQLNGQFIRHFKNEKVQVEWNNLNQINVYNAFNKFDILTKNSLRNILLYNNSKLNRFPDDFIHVNGAVYNFDILTSKQKKYYLKQYNRLMKWKQKNKHFSLIQPILF